jgi:hypothetical protein
VFGAAILDVTTRRPPVPMESIRQGSIFASEHAEDADDFEILLASHNALIDTRLSELKRPWGAKQQKVTDPAATASLTQAARLKRRQTGHQSRWGFGCAVRGGGMRNDSARAWAKLWQSASSAVRRSGVGSHLYTA